MATRIATLKAFINISNQQSCVEALCLWLMSPLLCGVEIACIQAGTNPLRKAIRWGFHGSSRPFAAPVCGIDNAGIVHVSLLSGEKADVTASQRSKQHRTACFKEDQGGRWGEFVTVVSRVVLGTSFAQSMSWYGMAAPGTDVQQLRWTHKQYCQRMNGQQRAECMSCTQRLWTSQRSLTFGSSSVTQWLDIKYFLFPAWMHSSKCHFHLVQEVGCIGAV